VSYSVQIYGHIDGDSADQIEADLAVRLGEVVSDRRYGVTQATLGGQHVGQVDLLASIPEGLKPDETDAPGGAEAGENGQPAEEATSS
jgi:hypothetical protein